MIFKWKKVATPEVVLRRARVVCVAIAPFFAAPFFCSPMIFSLVLATLAASAAAQSNTIVVGNIRVQALSDALIRVEPKGPRGWEDSPTFAMAGDRSSFAGVQIHIVNTTDGGTWMASDYYNIFVKAAADPTEASGTHLMWLQFFNKKQ